MTRASVRGAETVVADTHGYDAGKKVNGRKRHIALDTMRLLLAAVVTGAGIQDRDGAKPLLESSPPSCRRIQLLWADGGYADKLVDWAAETLNLALNVVKRSNETKGFTVLPRRCVRDYERFPAHHEAMVRWSMIRITSERLAKQGYEQALRRRP